MAVQGVGSLARAQRSRTQLRALRAAWPPLCGQRHRRCGDVSPARECEYPRLGTAEGLPGRGRGDEPWRDVGRDQRRCDDIDALHGEEVPNGTIDAVQRDQFVIRADMQLPVPVYRDLKKPLKGSDVEAWQDFLFERQLLRELPDATFGNNTEAATRRFQTEQEIQQTGVVDAATRERARLLGFKPVEDPTSL
jgi:hypothetical protein